MDTIYPYHTPRGKEARWLNCPDCGSIWLPGFSAGEAAVMAFLINAKPAGVPPDFEKVFSKNYRALLA
jgi:hypothetical protein